MNCLLCSQSLNLGKCPQLLSENGYDRPQTVRQLHLCHNCLSEHPNGQCNSELRCQVGNCKGFNHSTKQCNNFNATQASNQGQSQSTIEFRHRGEILNRNQFNFTNNSSSWNKNSASNIYSYNHHNRQSGNSNQIRERSRVRDSNNYNNNSSSNNNKL